jgi:hypothetical protein
VELSPEVSMSQYNTDEVELEGYYRISGGGNRRFAIRNIDEPKQSPIRRKNKIRQEEEIKPKTKRDHKKILYRLKYEWKDD